MFNPNFPDGRFSPNPKSVHTPKGQRKPAVDLQVIVDNKPLREHAHAGETFVAGAAGREYVLRVINNTGGRVSVVIAVDGRSVMDRTPATRTGSSYVLEAGAQADIPGWRLDNDGVAKFTFADPIDAYATTLGDPRSLGTIAAVFYAEKPRVRYLGRSNLEGGCHDGEPTLKARPLSPDLGTGFGRKTEHRVYATSFDRGEPIDELAIRYETAESLRARGIDPDGHGTKPADARPNPFPGDRPTGCVPPPGWTP